MTNRAKRTSFYLTHPLALAAALALLSGVADDAHARSKKATEARAQRVGKTRFDQGSAESTKERERRLLRECKGRPNAGACEGFAR